MNIKYILTLAAISATITTLRADNDVHTGELSGRYWEEGNHIDSVWENTYVKEGEVV